jgi:hypothetical protein
VERSFKQNYKELNASKERDENRSKLPRKAGEGSTYTPNKPRIGRDDGLAVFRQLVLNDEHSQYIQNRS